MELHNLNDIAAFVASVDTGSFTAAARQLGLTRSAVGKSIVRLESRLQVRLLNRTTRSLSLTDDGRVLYERCVGILQDLDEVEEALAFRRSTPSGRLRMSLPVALGRLHVVQHIERCLRDWPSLAIDATFSDRLVDLIDEGFDLAIRIGPPKEDSGLLTRTVAYQQMITCASPDYLKTGSCVNFLRFISRRFATFRPCCRSFSGISPSCVICQGHASPLMLFSYFSSVIAGCIFPRQWLAKDYGLLLPL